MKLEFKIDEQDFLAYQLFAASKSDRIKRKKRNGWLLLTIGSILAAIYFYVNYNPVMSIYFALMAIVCGFFYPRYFQWRYKKHYKTHIKDNYGKRFGQTERLEIREDSISAKDKFGEGKINLTEIEVVDETENHFFLSVSTGVSLIIPKRELENPDELRSYLQTIGLVVNNEWNWKW